MVEDDAHQTSARQLMTDAKLTSAGGPLSKDAQSPSCNSTYQRATLEVCLRVDVHKSQGHPEQYTAAALQKENVPHSQAALQGQAVDKDAEEPVGADTGHIYTVPLQVSAQPGEPHIHQLLEHQLVHLMVVNHNVVV